MAERLLTTRELQDLLQLDRVTIYKMVPCDAQEAHSMQALAVVDQAAGDESLSRLVDGRLVDDHRLDAGALQAVVGRRAHPALPGRLCNQGLKPPCARDCPRQPG